MRKFLPVLSLAALAACQPPVPNDTLGGVGFGDYDEYHQQREAQLNAERRAQAQAVQPPANYTSPVQEGAGYATASGAPTAGDLAAAGIGQGQLGQPVGAPLNAMGQAVSPSIPDVAPANPVAPVTGEAIAAAPAQSHTGISDENDFAAVASRETIASDKARMEQNRAQYQQIAPTALPERTATSAPNLISYALNAPSRLGQPYYKRGGLALSNSERACARYQSPEDAQLAFLKAGGPEKDRKNLDPDGDGFACTWDPTPFQKVHG